MNERALAEHQMANDLRAEIARLQRRIGELEESLEESQSTVHAIRTGQVDAVLVDDNNAPQVWMLEATDSLYLRLAQQAANAGTWEWDFKHQAMKGSESFWPILGMTPPAGRFEREVWEQLIHPDDFQRARQKLEQTLGGEDDDFYDEVRIRRPDGDQRWLAIRGRVMRDDFGGPDRIVGISLDITERKTAEEALRSADRRKDEFLAMLAHELRNPLAAISNAFRLFRGVSLSESEREWTGEVLERQILQLQCLIDDLLDISRITQGKVELRLHLLDFTDLLDRVVETLRPRFASAHQQLSVDYGNEPLWVMGDDARLEQVLVNLLNNAGKYTKKGGHIRLSAQLDADQVVVRVQDNGIGITPEMLPKVFDLFAQAERGLERTRRWARHRFGAGPPHHRLARRHRHGR